MEERYQVVIVGGGPVGVALAVELGQRGVSCALVERNLVPQRIPKGQNLTQRTLEHFYFWQCVDQLRAARVMPKGYPIGGVTAYGSLMGEYWYTPPGRETVRPYFFQDNERLPQYLTEGVLRTRLAAIPSVRTYFGWVADSFEQDEGGVRVAIAQDGGSGQRVLAADYLVGCDGARSMVREQLGIGRSGSDFQEKMVLALFRSRSLHEALQRFPERTTYRVLHPDLKGAWMFFGRVDVGEGWFFHAPVPQDATPDNYDYLGLVQRAAGVAFAAEFDHIGYWDLRVAAADRYRQGRAFIAGDACHTHPPYGGYGLNTGLEDVANLGWKLTAALEGWGGEALLDSYTQERRPIFVETGRDVIAAGIESDRAFLERYHPDRDRAAFEQAWKRLGTADPSSDRDYEPHYEGSAVVAGPPGAVCSIHGKHAIAALPGHHLTPQPLATGRDVYEALGQGFTLLDFGAALGTGADFERAARSLGAPLKVVRDASEAARAGYEARLVLVRPDQYVAWVGDAAPRDLEGLLTLVTGGRGA